MARRSTWVRMATDLAVALNENPEPVRERFRFRVTSLILALEMGHLDPERRRTRLSNPDRRDFLAIDGTVIKGPTDNRHFIVQDADGTPRASHKRPYVRPPPPPRWAGSSACPEPVSEINVSEQEHTMSNATSGGHGLRLCPRLHHPAGRGGSTRRARGRRRGQDLRRPRLRRDRLPPVARRHSMTPAAPAHVELLYTESCPNWEATAIRLSIALQGPAARMSMSRSVGSTLPTRRSASSSLAPR